MPPRGRFAPALLVVIAVAVAASTSCSHYGYADAEADDESAPPAAAVSVWTVATPADDGIDAARLTRAFSGAMNQRGVAARWASVPGAVDVRCSVSQTEIDGFGQALFAHARVYCRVGRVDEPPEQFEASGRYVASAGRSASALAHSHAALQEAAAVDALETVADRIARFVLHTYR